MASTKDPEALAELSARIVAEIDRLKQLEAESRALPIGSRESALKSAEVAAQARLLYRMTTEQLSLAEEMAPQPETIDELDQAPEG
jgi:hypothetical protein